MDIEYFKKIIIEAKEYSKEQENKLQEHKKKPNPKKPMNESFGVQDEFSMKSTKH